MDISYSTPEKLQDGRYFVKTSPYLVTLTNVKITRDDGFKIYPVSESSDVFKVEDKIVDDATSHSVEWFNKEIQRDIISNYFQNSVEDSVIQVDDNVNAKGKSQVVFFNEAKDMCEFNPDGVYNALIQLEGIWFLKRSFGLVWKLVQARVKKEVKRAQCLIKDEDSD